MSNQPEDIERLVARAVKAGMLLAVGVACLAISVISIMLR